MDPMNGKNYSFWGEEVEIGIDEAGRGPVLGPMVYGAAFWPAREDGFSKEMKKRYGFADSKQLNEPQREKIWALINETRFTDIGYFVSVLSAEYLSNTMLADWDKGGKNLNKISHDTAIDLIKQVIAAGFKVKRVYLDTVGSPEKYKIIIEKALNDPEIHIVVESKADDTYPVVSAASICAKVTRDHALTDFEYRESKEFSKNVGCGYPGDKTTKEWLLDNMDPVFGFPSIVRFSWKTSYEKLDKKGQKFDWLDQIQESDFGGNKSDFKKQEAQKNQKEQAERAALGPGEKERRMNVATHRLRINRGFTEF